MAKQMEQAAVYNSRRLTKVPVNLYCVIYLWLSCYGNSSFDSLFQFPVDYTAIHNMQCVCVCVCLCLCVYVSIRPFDDCDGWIWMRAVVEAILMLTGPSWKPQVSKRSLGAELQGTHTWQTEDRCTRRRRGRSERKVSGIRYAVEVCRCLLRHNPKQQPEEV